MADDGLIHELARRLTQAEREIERLQYENRYLLHAVRTTSAGRTYLWMQQCAAGQTSIMIHPNRVAEEMNIMATTACSYLAELRDLGLIRFKMQPNGFFHIEFRILI